LYRKFAHLKYFIYSLVRILHLDSEAKRKEWELYTIFLFLEPCALGLKPFEYFPGIGYGDGFYQSSNI
jgi:hypothetical protein